MSELNNVFENFDFQAEPSEAVFDLFSRVITDQATVSSLREMIFKHLSECSGKSEDELLKEYENIYSKKMHELLTEFVSKYGIMNNRKSE